MSVNNRSGIPPSMTMVNPVLRGFVARLGRRGASGFICRSSLVG
jgi:hypothetical protein